MNVQELINLLEQVRDKELPVLLLSEDLESIPCTHIRAQEEGVYLYNPD